MSQEHNKIIDIPMNDWSTKKLQRRQKWATTRTDRYGERGDLFEAANTVFELTHVVRVPLRVVAEYFYAVEGCNSKEGFIEVWEDIHYRKGYEPEWMVYLHLFKVADVSNL